MRALVMGGTEFISLHLLQSLLRRGHEVTVFNRGRRQERLPAGVRAVIGDRKDHAGLRERLRGERFDGVFDVTYAPTVGEDVAALLDALEGRPHLIFVSTGRVYDHGLASDYGIDKPGPVFGQNLVYDCHAVHTTHKLRGELGVRPRYTLASGLAQTWKWYRADGLVERPIDTSFEDQLLAQIGA